MLNEKIQVHDWANFDHTVTKNMEIGDLKSYTHDLINEEYFNSKPPQKNYN